MHSIKSVSALKLVQVSKFVVAAQFGVFDPSNLLFRTGETRSLHLLQSEECAPIAADKLKKIIKSQFGEFQVGHTSLTVNCPGCSEKCKKTSAGDSHLNINLFTGFCFCRQIFNQFCHLNVFLKNEVFLY